MPNYQKSKIYGIYYEDELVYIGSTIQSLAVRMGGHKRDSFQKNRQNMKIYSSMNEKGFENFKIELIKYFPCNSKEELLREEGLMQREYKPQYNSNIAGRTDQEYYKDNCEKIKKYNRERHQLNKEENNIKRKERRNHNLELSNKLAMESYYRNQTRILERKKEKVKCECGKEYTRGNKRHHIKTSYHISKVENENKNII